MCYIQQHANLAPLQTQSSIEGGSSKRLLLRSSLALPICQVRGMSSDRGVICLTLVLVTFALCSICPFEHV